MTSNHHPPSSNGQPHDDHRRNGDPRRFSSGDFLPPQPPVDDTPPSDDQLDLLAWSRKFLPHYFTLPASRMHRWLARQLDELRTTRGVRINVIGPRGSAKSTLATLAYVLRVAVEGWEPYIWIVCDTADQAQSHLENIRLELIENELLSGTYNVAPSTSRKLRRKALELENNVTIECFGTGQRIRGRRRREHRPALIVCDDLQNDQHIDSARQRDRSRRWFHGSLLPAGTPQTNVVNVATALHYDALALQLSRMPGWISRTFAAVLQWPDAMDLWHRWELIYCDTANPDSHVAARAFYDEHKKEMDAGADVLWPQVEDLYTLMAQRVQSGTAAFEREKQGSPYDPERCEWPDEYFDSEMWFDDWPESLTVRTMALDPSKGQDAHRGDYSAYIMLGVDGEGRMLVEADMARRPTPKVVSDGLHLLRRFRPDRFGVEANQYQELLAPLFNDALRRAGLHSMSACLLWNNVNKLVRIRRLGGLLSMRKFRFRSRNASTKLLVDQLRQFPLADHDDGPDALEMAVRIVDELEKGKMPDDGLGDTLI